MNPAARYLEVTASLKALEDEKDELRAILMACADAPPEGFTVRVSESTADRVESLKAIGDKSPSLLAALHAAGCIKAVVSTRLTVKAVRVAE